MRIDRLSRSGMKASERQLRSKLNQMIAGAGLVRGTLTVRKAMCGKPSCHCATGEPHRALCLTASAKGKYLHPSQLKAGPDPDCFKKSHQSLEVERAASGKLPAGVTRYHVA